MGESTNGPVRLQFDRWLLTEYRGATTTSFEPVAAPVKSGGATSNAASGGDP